MNNSSSQKQIDIKKYENFIFDMDGTLIDAENLHFESFKKALDHFFKLPLTREDFKYFFAGTESNHSFPNFLQYNGIIEFNLDEILFFTKSVRREKLEKDFDSVVKLKPFAKEFLEILYKNERKICLATSASRTFAEYVLEKANIYYLFDDFVFAEDTEKSKPDPEIFLTAMNKLDGNLENSVIFEDSKNGITAGKKSKIFTIAIYTEGMNDEFVQMADFIVSGYEDFVKSFSV
ncbi:MAG: HAD family phosphatase [Patescibacteria group bacterium]